MLVADRPLAPVAIRTDLGAIFVSMELSKSTWLVTSLSPDAGERMSRHTIRAGDIAGLFERFAQLRAKAKRRAGQDFAIIAIQETGLDGFWIHRVLQDEGIESYVVDSASIATSRRRRRAKIDKIDGEALVRALLAYKRGEPRVCDGSRTECRRGGSTTPEPRTKRVDGQAQPCSAAKSKIFQSRCRRRGCSAMSLSQNVRPEYGT